MQKALDRCLAPADAEFAMQRELGGARVAYGDEGFAIPAAPILLVEQFWCREGAEVSVPVKASADLIFPDSSVDNCTNYDLGTV